MNITKIITGIIIAFIFLRFGLQMHLKLEILIQNAASQMEANNVMAT